MWAACHHKTSTPSGSAPAGRRMCRLLVETLRASSQEISEFEFHISPACSSSGPKTGVDTSGTSSNRRRVRRMRECGKPGRATAFALRRTT